MKVKEIISFLEQQGEWVNRRMTRDHLLCGNENTEVNKIIVCWVATYDIIDKAIEDKCHFIICHENPFYLSSTNMHSAIIEAQQHKLKILEDHQICIYRCHDLWDLYPKYGVLDSWAKILNLPFDHKNKYQFYRWTDKLKMTTKDLALHIRNCIEPYGQSGIEVIGDLNKNINVLAIGTGAITDVFQMVDLGADVCLVSDDGINNWTATQWAMDHHIPLLVVNHMTSENAGMVGLKEYLTSQFPNLEVEMLFSNYRIHHFS